MIKKFKEYIKESNYFDEEKMSDYLLWLDDHYGAETEYINNYLVIRFYIESNDLLKLSKDLEEISNQIELLKNRVKSDYGDNTSFIVSPPMSIKADTDMMYLMIEIEITLVDESGKTYGIKIETPEEFEKLIDEGNGDRIFRKINNRNKNIEYSIKDKTLEVCVYDDDGIPGFGNVGGGRKDDEFVNYIESFRYTNGNQILEFFNFVDDEGSNGNIFYVYQFDVMDSGDEGYVRREE